MLILMPMRKYATVNIVLNERVEPDNGHEVPQEILADHNGRDIHDRHSAFETFASKSMCLEGASLIVCKMEEYSDPRESESCERIC